MDREVWRWVVGYENRYMVSNAGNVMTVPKKTHAEGFLLTKSMGANGYQNVHLRKDGVDKRVSVHRLVAIAFIPNPNSLPEINHIDGDKTNNSVENLEWCTRSDNKKHSIRVLGNPKPPRPSQAFHQNLTFEQAQRIRKDSRSQREIAEDYGVSQGSISLIKRGITYKKED